MPLPLIIGAAAVVGGGAIIEATTGYISNLLGGTDNTIVLKAQQVYEPVIHGDSTSLREASTLTEQHAAKQKTFAENAAKLEQMLASAWQGEASDAAQKRINELTKEATESAGALHKNAPNFGTQVSSFDSLQGDFRNRPLELPPPEAGLGARLAPWDTDTEDRVKQNHRHAQEILDLYSGYEENTRENAKGIEEKHGNLGQMGSDQYGTDPYGRDPYGTGNGRQFDAERSRADAEAARQAAEQQRRMQDEADRMRRAAEADAEARRKAMAEEVRRSQEEAEARRRQMEEEARKRQQVAEARRREMEEAARNRAASYTPSGTRAAGFTPSDYSGGFGSGSSGGFGAGSGAGGSTAAAGFGPAGGGAVGAGAGAGAGGLGDGKASGAMQPGGGGAGAGGGAAGTRGGGGMGRGGGMGMGGMVGGAGAGKGQGDDKEHKRKVRYAENPDEVFGTDEKAVPPVIGDK